MSEHKSRRGTSRRLDEACRKVMATPGRKYGIVGLPVTEKAKIDMRQACAAVAAYLRCFHASV
jgi:hypothetical protein